VPRAADPPEVLERFNAELELVQIIARQVARSIGGSIDHNELVSFGQEGLLDAARRYDATRGVPFRSYANYRVKGAIFDGVRSMSQLPRRAHERLKALGAAYQATEGAVEDVHAPQPPGSGAAQAEHALPEHLASMATAMAIGLLAQPAWSDEGEPTAVSGSDNPEEAVERAQLVHLVQDAVGSLPEQEAELVRRHYLGGERLEDVGRDLGLSKSWACRLNTRALARLTKRLRAEVT
jgi:RNA polymerase sigma factor FliA